MHFDRERGAFTIEGAAGQTDLIPEFRDYTVELCGVKATAPAIFIILGLTVILIMCIIAIRSAIDSYDKFFRIFQKIFSEQLFLHRNDAPCFYKHRK